MIFLVGPTQVRSDGRTLTWTSGMGVDADGSPRAYSPLNSGLPALDDLRNAGKPGNWWGVVTDEHGVPVIQDSEDEAPGYYISPTALFDASIKDERNTRRYVNSEKIRYIAVPPVMLKAGVRKGDLCVVRYKDKTASALVGDIGPGGKVGEGSIALCQALGVDPFRGKPKHHLLGINNGVTFTILLGSASKPAWPRPTEEIDQYLRDMLPITSR